MLFCIYVIVSCVFFFGGNPYQHSVYLTSANAVSAYVYGTANNVTSYFGLRDINDDLQRRNAELETEVLALRTRLRQFEELEYAEKVPVDSALQRYRFIIAHVINNSINHPHNYITIEKGELDGIRPEMGVVDQNGIVGKVDIVGPHTSRVISLLNSNLPISCKVKRTQQVGSLKWDGKDHTEAILAELPRHATFQVGDTVVSSGYSTTFPEGVPVGVIMSEMKEYDDNFHTLRVKLFTDFSRLSTVRVIEDGLADELSKIESKEEGNQPEMKPKR